MDTTFLDGVDALLMRVAETGRVDPVKMIDQLADLVTAERKRLNAPALAEPALDAFFDNIADVLGDNPYAVEPGLLSVQAQVQWEALKDQGLIMRDRSVGGYRLTPTGWARLETIRKNRTL
jgi:hypothetical protein